MSTIKVNISSNLRKLRKLQDITVSQLHKVIDIEENTLRKYETDYNTPSIDNIIKISTYFNISVDFLILWDNCDLIRNKRLLLLAEKIDKMGVNEKYKIEITTDTLLDKTNHSRSSFEAKDLILSDNISRNIKLLRENKKVSQRELADYLNQTPASITYYEKDKRPSTEKVLKLAQYFNVSIHYLITGKKLSYNFIDKAFEETILKADKQLPLDQHKFLIHLMTRIIEDA